MFFYYIYIQYYTNMDMITDPNTHASYSIYSDEGIDILKSYVTLYTQSQSGGSSNGGGGGSKQDISSIHPSKNITKSGTQSQSQTQSLRSKMSRTKLDNVDNIIETSANKQANSKYLPIIPESRSVSLNYSDVDDPCVQLNMYADTKIKGAFKLMRECKEEEGFKLFKKLFLPEIEELEGRSIATLTDGELCSKYIVFIFLGKSKQGTDNLPMIKNELAEDTMYTSILGDEPTFISKLKHCKESDSYYILARNKGSSLEKYINFNISVKKKILYGCLEQLIKLHDADYVHRDIKLGNILYDSSTEKSTLIDFGFSQKCVGDKRCKGLAGTPNYISDDDYRTRSFDKKSDIFAFGRLIYNFITRRYNDKGFYIDGLNMRTTQFILYLLAHKLKSQKTPHEQIKRRMQYLKQSSRKLPKQIIDNPVLLDLLQKMMARLSENRITFKEVLEHEYWKDVDDAIM
jgi:serine/threonine protein kinase